MGVFSSESRHFQGSPTSDAGVRRDKTDRHRSATETSSAIQHNYNAVREMTRGKNN